MALLPGLQPLADMAPTATDSKDSQPLAERPIAEGRAMAHAMLEQMVANLYESVEPAPVEYDRAVPVGDTTIDIRGTDLTTTPLSRCTCTSTAADSGSAPSITSTPPADASFAMSAASSSQWAIA